MDTNFVSKLLELSQKYKTSTIEKVDLIDGAVLVKSNVGTYCFFYDFEKDFSNLDAVAVPMFHWQQKRRYAELQGLIDRKIVYPALSMRIHHIVPHDNFTRSLKDIILFETNLFEFVTRSKIHKIFADFSGNTYTNCIVSSDKEIKGSLELGFSPDESEPVLLHEVVCRNGTASDLPVDTQINQYPIYVIKGERTDVYNEIDFELYGMDNTQADCIRFILWVLSDVERVQQLQDDYNHLENVYNAAVSASATLTYTIVED